MRRLSLLGWLSDEGHEELHFVVFSRETQPLQPGLLGFGPVGKQQIHHCDSGPKQH